MATLQNIRSKGPLLVIVIGLALFAFIAGDAWKVLQPHQSQDVGEVNGESISAQDFQALVEEYTEVIKFSSGNSALSDEQTNQIKDEVWRTYVNNKLIEKEAKKLGLVVSKAEIQAIINAGVHPMLQQTPFRNPQTGAFDKDMLKKFLVDYSKMNKAQMPSQYAEYYESMYKFWSFLEKSLIQARLQEKYQALITKSLFSNPVEAQDAFDARVEQSDLLLAAVPYSSIVDSTIVTMISITISFLISCLLGDKTIRGEFIQAAYRSSAALLGIAFIQNIYGNAGMAPLMIIGSVPLYNMMAVVVLSVFKPGQSGLDRTVVKKTIKGIVTNPILIGIVAGLVWSALKIPMPAIPKKVISSIGNVATPMGLMAMGATFDIKKAFGKIKPSAIAAFMKLIGLCAIFLPIAVKLGFRTDKLVAILIMLGSATTVSSFVMAKNMGHEGTLSSSVVMLTTMFSAFTVTGWLYILRHFMLI